MVKSYLRLLCIAICLTIILAHQNQGGQQAFGVNTQQPHVHQQPPQQQFQQGQGQQQQQPQHGHGHPTQPSGVFDRQQVQDREHIKEHLDGVAQADTSKMTEQELQFHYFKMHDSDNNNKLDGCELIKSLIHWHETEEEKPTTEENHELRIFNDDELANMIDPILEGDDKNRDGCIDYAEYSEMLKNPSY